MFSRNIKTSEVRVLVRTKEGFFLLVLVDSSKVVQTKERLSLHLCLREWLRRLKR